jgi:hypothetical protein
MSAPVTNQAYSQQVNQAFDMLKYATPQQMQLVSQQVQQNPNSPEALAAVMAAQFQQQLRAPNPQAPQQTVLQQKLGEFAQTSQQGLPQVGGNQMAMQQAAQQDPMRNAGIGAAPENQQASASQEQAPQEEAPQQAATGGLVALAHGGEVKHFANGGLGSLAKYLSQGEADPNAYDADSAIASMLNENTTPMLNVDDEPTQKVKIAPIGVDDVVSMANPTSSAARNEAAPTYRERKDAIKELLGAPEDYSEEIATAKEDVRSANKEKWGGALAQGIGAYLSAPTQYQSRALGAGLLAGASGYAQGAKDEQSANKDLMALQLAHKKALVSGDKEAATMLLNNMAEQEKAIALAKSKMAEQKYTRETELMKNRQVGEYGLAKEDMSNQAAVNLKNMDIDAAKNLEGLKSYLKEKRVDPSDKQGVITSVLSYANGQSLSKEDTDALMKNYMSLLSAQPTVSENYFGKPLEGGMFLK